MDPYIRGQELIQCDLCKTEMVQVHCDTCHVKLCNACIGEHMASDESKKKHEIVRFVFRKSIPLYPQCSSHVKERCEMYCKQCDKPVCNNCISSDQHSSHQFLKILEVFDERKEKIIKEQNELNNDIYPTYQKIASDVENMIKQIEKGYGDLSVAITKNGEEWHQEIDKVVTKLKAKVDEIKTKHLKTLQRQLDEINEKTSEIQDEINTINLVNIDSQDISELFSITFNVDKYRKLPQNIVLSFPTFTPGTIQSEDFCSLFGTISPGKLTSSGHGYSSPPAKQLLNEPEIITSINTEYALRLYNVAHQSDEEIWTRGDTNTMKLYSVSQGSLLKSITTKSGSISTDIAVTKDGHLVYTDPVDRTVNIVKNEKIETLIKLKKWKPYNICSTSSGDLLVVMSSDDFQQSKVVRYSGSTEKQTIQSDDEGYPLYLSVTCISENKNLDICVADERAMSVVVVNQAGKVRFKYLGYNPTPMNQTFSPRGITTDSQSHILIADINNDCVHILDQDGQFLCYIDCGLSYPWGLCVDTNDNLFVAQSEDKQVKKIKYMQES